MSVWCWTHSPPIKRFAGGGHSASLRQPGHLGWSTCVNGVYWHLDFPLPAKQRAVALKKPHWGLPLGQPVAVCRWLGNPGHIADHLFGMLWWSYMREMEGGKEDSMYLETTHVIYLFLFCLLVCWFCFCFLKATPYSLYLQRNMVYTKLLVELWHF